MSCGRGRQGALTEMAVSWTVEPTFVGILVWQHFASPEKMNSSH